MWHIFGPASNELSYGRGAGPCAGQPEACARPPPAAGRESLAPHGAALGAGVTESVIALTVSFQVRKYRKHVKFRNSVVNVLAVNFWLLTVPSPL